MKRLVVGSLLAVCGCRAATAGQAEGTERTTSAAGPQRLPIIDMHLHADLPPMPVPAGAPSICRPAPCTGEGRATASQEETLAKTLEAMDRLHIVKAFLSGIDHEVVQRWVQAAPGRFIAAPFILDPNTSDPAVLRERLERGEIGGIGEIASQLAGIPPNDPRLEPYFALADEFDVPVLVHTLGIGPELPSFRVAAGDPLLLEDVLVRHPTSRIFVENCGYPFDDEMIAMMSQYPGLYCDVSTIGWVLPRSAFHGYLETLTRAGLGERILFGSDQMRWPDRIGAGVEAIRDAPFLTEHEKRDILLHNAERFLRLEATSG